MRLHFNKFALVSIILNGANLLKQNTKNLIVN